MNTNNRVKIVTVNSYLPEKRVSNDELPSYLDTSDEWIRSHTGIGARHIAADDQACSDLAYIAAGRALKAASLDPGELDLIIVATATPDYNGFPSTACIVQERLQAHNAGAFDLMAACTGFIYSLEMAHGQIAAGLAENVLVIGAETLTKICNWNDRSTCVLFGDGAGAALLQLNRTDDSDILDSLLFSDGSGADNLIVTGGGSRNPITEGFDPVQSKVFMDGRAVYNFAVAAVVKVIEQLISRSGISIDDIAYIIPHQANEKIIRAAAKRLKFPIEKFYINIEHYANTSAATIPIALDEMLVKKVIKRGDLLLMVGFGGGLTYGGNLIRW